MNKIPVLPGAVLGLALLVTGCETDSSSARIQAGQASELDIGVRTEVVDKPESKLFGKAPPTPEHSKLFGIIAVLMIRSDDKLVKPVDANLLAALATKELEARGFHRNPKGQKPDILISILYGRGMLRNPYLANAGERYGNSENSGSNMVMEQERDQDPSAPQHVGGGATSVVSVTDPTQGLKEKSIGFEEKLQRASYEKLYLRVQAWRYPTDRKSKPKELWNTTILVDDPEHRDLNTIAGEMFAAGAPYFDKEIKDEEVYVTRPLPDGRVQVGTPEVVEPAPATTR